MAQIRAAKRFIDWLDRPKDIDGRARIQARIERLAGGNPGQHRRLKLGVFELKIDVGPGYRVHCTERNRHRDRPAVRRRQIESDQGH